MERSDGHEEAGSRIVKLKGLPYRVLKSEIVQFFEGLEVVYVHFVYEADGRPSGLAFAEFTTAACAVQALKKRGHYLKKRYIKILQVSYQEMQEQVLLGTAAIPSLRPQNRRLNNETNAGGRQMGQSDAGLGQHSQMPYRHPPASEFHPGPGSQHPGSQHSPYGYAAPFPSPAQRPPHGGAPGGAPYLHSFSPSGNYSQPFSYERPSPAHAPGPCVQPHGSQPGAPPDEQAGPGWTPDVAPPAAASVRSRLTNLATLSDRTPWSASPVTVAPTPPPPQLQDFHGSIVTLQSPAFRALLDSPSAVHVRGLAAPDGGQIQLHAARLFSRFRCDLVSSLVEVDAVSHEPTGPVWMLFDSPEEAALACARTDGTVFNNCELSVVQLKPSPSAVHPGAEVASIAPTSSGIVSTFQSLGTETHLQSDPGEAPPGAPSPAHAAGLSLSTHVGSLSLSGDTCPATA